MNLPRSTVLFDNLGPYHVARLAAASRIMPVSAIEFSGRSAEYAWSAPEAAGIQRTTVHPTGPAYQLSAGVFRNRLRKLLSEAKSEVIAIPGWSGRGAFVAMEWAMETRTPYILMSDSTEWDEPRVTWKEAVKSRFVAGASAALVAGTPHADYMITLGMPPSRIFNGYDVVDNQAFSQGADRWRRESAELGVKFHPYFLASCRFVAKKNLPILLDALAMLASHSATHSKTPPWDLCLLGDGELREELIRHAEQLGVEVLHGAPWECPAPDHGRGRLLLPGFRQIGDLFRFYAGAGAFVHASTTEQWGLVVNEAMASGLPVAVSNRCGCAADLVEEARNGWTFPPGNRQVLADILVRLCTMDSEERQLMGDQSRILIASWGPDRFREGFAKAAECAVSHRSTKAPFTTRLALRGLSLASR